MNVADRTPAEDWSAGSSESRDVPYRIPLCIVAGSPEYPSRNVCSSGTTNTGASVTAEFTIPGDFYHRNLEWGLGWFGTVDVKGVVITTHGVWIYNGQNLYSGAVVQAEDFATPLTLLPGDKYALRVTKVDNTHLQVQTFHKPPGEDMFDYGLVDQIVIARGNNAFQWLDLHVGCPGGTFASASPRNGHRSYTPVEQMQITAFTTVGF